MTRTTISQTDLAHGTPEILERVHRGEMVVLERDGKEQIVLLDILDYRLLRSLAASAVKAGADSGVEESLDAQVMRDYLAEEISLGKAAELLHLSRFELQERFLRLGVPLRLGPSSIEEARAEVAVARKYF
ncbi:MAG TPA: hypothetical protein VF756_27590 [Thermoanaerobaculia bacterium]